MNNGKPAFQIGERIKLKISPEVSGQIREIDRLSKYEDGNFAYQIRFPDLRTDWFRECEIEKK